jgi:pyoverdine/dityrosine biosynthesis protein Dit1
MEETSKNNETAQLGIGAVMPRELSLHNYWDSSTPEGRTEIVERAFKMIEKQKEYIALLSEELDGVVVIAAVHGWKSNLVEQGKKLRGEMALLHGA